MEPILRFDCVVHFHFLARDLEMTPEALFSKMFPGERYKRYMSGYQIIDTWAKRYDPQTEEDEELVEFWENLCEHLEEYGGGVDIQGPILVLF